MSSALPDPDAAALEVSSRLLDLIRAEIEAAGGWLDFARYMELALYAPGLGYYSGGSEKLGRAGDFVTAPEISPLFGRVLARELRAVLDGFDDPVILELGAGSGALAEAILASLDQDFGSRPGYRILETSADLRRRQMSRLSGYGSRVRWLDALPEPGFEGVVLANEVMDALPVTRFSKVDGDVFALGVGLHDDRLVWREQCAGPGLRALVESLESAVGSPFPDGYRSEICRSLPAWISSLSDVLRRGAVWLIDYGLVEREYYHPLRTDGTLICHYRHRAHSDPFFHPGLQDISAWVNFSS
ncbi:MAG TPA: SAM-dependent methyltransferase, partial [Gammaproteobacteria bacterium]